MLKVGVAAKVLNDPQVAHSAIDLHVIDAGDIPAMDAGHLLELKRLWTLQR
jgi:hypothetical protein